MNGYGGKDFEKKVLRREWKTPRERSTSGAGLQYDDGEKCRMPANRAIVIENLNAKEQFMFDSLHVYPHLCCPRLYPHPRLCPSMAVQCVQLGDSLANT